MMEATTSGDATHNREELPLPADARAQMAALIAMIRRTGGHGSITLRFTPGAVDVGGGPEIRFRLQQER